MGLIHNQLSRVGDLVTMVNVLKENGSGFLEKFDGSKCGRFAWVIDPAGDEIELWQPPVGR